MAFKMKANTFSTMAHPLLLLLWGKVYMEGKALDELASGELQWEKERKEPGILGKLTS